MSRVLYNRPPTATADVYVINSQGMGETFGRVTIEAMTFGLPVLGTDGGGTTEIVERNVTGLIHPVGSPGTEVLARNVEFLLQNPSARKQKRSRQMKYLIDINEILKWDHLNANNHLENTINPVTQV